MGEKHGPEAQVREIRRRTRHRYSTGEKVRIVLEGLKGEESIAELPAHLGPVVELSYLTAFRRSEALGPSDRESG